MMTNAMCTPNTNVQEKIIRFSSPVVTATPNMEKPKDGEKQKTTLIVLNSPIPDYPSVWFEHLWNGSDEHICADGGANRLFHYSKDYIPSRIRGDLDSLDPAIRAYYENQNVLVEEDACQDTNDLDKALQVCVVNGDNTSSSCMSRVIVYGAFGGRFDQEMASIQALYKWGPRFNWQLYLYSDETCAFLIPANCSCEIRYPFHGTHNLQDDPAIGITLGEGPTCGLIPMGCRVDSIVTTGLKWNLDGTTQLEFGGLVSTSNRITQPVVTVRASQPVVFTAELLTRK
jgi:thiamine pyrophosphokinase